MSEPQNNATLPPSAEARPEDLPPVEPPSAGFIVQLFFIPALIVAAVIGVWLLFGKVAEQKANWGHLVTELRSDNEHRRWRAAHELARLLTNEQATGEPTQTADSPSANVLVPQRLTQNEEVCRAITDLLKERLQTPTGNEEELANREFLARTLGTLEVESVVMPALAMAMDEAHDVAVRKGALYSLAAIASRRFQATALELPEDKKSGVNPQAVLELNEPLAEPTVDDPAVFDKLIEAAQCEDASVRHLAAYTLAMVSGAEAMDELKAMLSDGDEKTRANAAIGLSRNGLADGVPTLLKLLQDSARKMEQSEFQSLPEEKKKAELERLQFERPIIRRNCVRALGGVWPKLTDEQQQQARTILSDLSKNAPAADVRTEASTLLNHVSQN